jgi:hypothetical protein
MRYHDKTGFDGHLANMGRLEKDLIVEQPVLEGRYNYDSSACQCLIKLRALQICLSRARSGASQLD